VSVTFRSVDGDDLEALLAFSTDEPVSWIGADRYRAESATRNYRPEWSWLALRDGRPVGRALWWGSAGAEAPSTLDDLLVAPGPSDDERTAIAAGLIAAGAGAFGSLQEWIVDVAVEWHADGLVVGFVIATRTAYDAAISSIGVLPQHRGRGVVDGLLAEGVRVHAEAGAPRVVGTTDATNTPMRRAFERAGFVVTKRRIVFEH
jgi:ribosomal protein S18 acetylase RimI-like enzyme